jgi:hypothetical protein
VEDTILCHKSASDGGALAGMSWKIVVSLRGFLWRLCFCMVK